MRIPTILVIAFLTMAGTASAQDETEWISGKTEAYPVVEGYDIVQRRVSLGINATSKYYQYIQEWNIRNDQNQKAILETLQRIEARLDAMEKQP